MSHPKSPVFLITGAGKGIGHAIANELCARKQAGVFEPRLVLCSRTRTDLDAVADDARRAGIEAIAQEAELSSPQDIERVVSAALGAFGTIDCLVNNAGVGRFGDLLSLTEEDLDFVLNTNLKGTFLLTQKVFAVMQKKRSGHVIFITSIAAEQAFEQSAIYCMSKFGQKGMVEVLKLYGRKCNVRVTNIMPGAVYTPMWGELEQAVIDRMMQPEDVARVAVECYLTDPRASIEEVVLRPTGGDL